MQNTVTRQAKDAIGASTTTTIFCDPNATTHQIKINKDGATSGTLALTAKSAGSATAETMYDQNGAAIVFNCASSTAQTYTFNNALDAIFITPSALDGTYKFTYSCW